MAQVEQHRPNLLASRQSAAPWRAFGELFSRSPSSGPAGSRVSRARAAAGLAFCQQERAHATTAWQTFSPRIRRRRRRRRSHVSRAPGKILARLTPNGLFVAGLRSIRSSYCSSFVPSQPKRTPSRLQLLFLNFDSSAKAAADRWSQRKIS